MHSWSHTSCFHFHARVVRPTGSLYSDKVHTPQASVTFCHCTSTPSPSWTTCAGSTLIVFTSRRLQSLHLHAFAFTDHWCWLHTFFTPCRLQSLHLHAFAFTDHGFSAFTSRLQSLTRLVITSSGSYPGVRGSVGLSVGVGDFSAFTSRLQSLTRLVITSSGSYPGVRESVGSGVGALSFLRRVP